jgi:Pyridoxamine 5'-phosphate oxidase
MTRQKATSKKKTSSGRARANQPANAKVGLPRVPPMYGLKGERFLPWKHAEDRLERSRNYWICTSRPDGRPHSIPVWGMWLDGALYFGTARASRKGRNLAYRADVSIHLESGDDVVILEGLAVEVSDSAILKKLDAAYRKKYKMPLMIVPEGLIFGVHPRVVLSWTERDFPNNATRWEFAS